MSLNLAWHLLAGEWVTVMKENSSSSPIWKMVSTNIVFQPWNTSGAWSTLSLRMFHSNCHSSQHITFFWLEEMTVRRGCMTCRVDCCKSDFNIVRTRCVLFNFWCLISISIRDCTDCDSTFSTDLDTCLLTIPLVSCLRRSSFDCYSNIRIRRNHCVALGKQWWWTSIGTYL